jgi:hypothetical protein
MLQTGRSLVKDAMKSLIFFNSPHISSCTMVLGFTQPLTEMITGGFLEVEHCQCVRLITSPPSLGRLSRQCGRLDELTTI